MSREDTFVIIKPRLRFWLSFLLGTIKICCSCRCNCFDSASRWHEKTAQCWRKLYRGRTWGVHAIAQENNDRLPLEAQCGWYRSHPLPCLSDGCQLVAAFPIMGLFFTSWFYLMHFCSLQVLQDNNAKKEELRMRAKGLKTLGKIFQVWQGCIRSAFISVDTSL